MKGKAKELRKVISLDEFKGNSASQKYNRIKGYKIFDILPASDHCGR